MHSRYWRAPHWSYEGGYLFEFPPNDRLRAQLIRDNRLQQIHDPKTDPEARPCVATCPAWFAPTSLTDYEVWAYDDEPNSNFRVLIDQTTGHIFLGDFQL